MKCPDFIHGTVSAVGKITETTLIYLLVSDDETQK